MPQRMKIIAGQIIWRHVLRPIQARKSPGVLGVVNVGIGGNRVLLDGYGPNAVSRINPDLIARSGARYVIILESINDIGRFTSDHQPYGDLAQRLEAGIAQIAAQAHQHHIKVIGATLTPYEGCGYYSEAGNEVRNAVNSGFAQALSSTALPTSTKLCAIRKTRSISRRNTILATICIPKMPDTRQWRPPSI